MKSTLVSQSNSSVFGRSEASTKRPIIGLRCADIKLGVEFYREFQTLMAQIFPREYDRPQVYMDLGGDDELASTLLTIRADFDFILCPRLKARANPTPKDVVSSDLFLEAILRKSPGHIAARDTQPENVLSRFELIDIKQKLYPLKAPSAFTMGIVGGMGPMADRYTAECVIKKIFEKSLQGELRVYLVSDPRVPRTTKQKLNLPILNSYRKRLQEFLNLPELNLIIVPSNTFHTGFQYILAQIHTNNRIYSIIRAVAAKIAKDYQGQTVGLLATTTTIESRIYEKTIRAAGALPVIPQKEYQAMVEAGIAAMKAGRNVEAKIEFEKVAQHLRSLGATTILLGCTEIPLAFEDAMDSDFLDSADILASAAVANSQQLKTDPYLICIKDALEEFSKLLPNESTPDLKAARIIKSLLSYSTSNKANYHRLQNYVNDLLYEKKPVKDFSESDRALRYILTKHILKANLLVSSSQHHQKKIHEQIKLNETSFVRRSRL
jgi:aspartate racemase